ncbi:PIR Superfamily Protein [Plasmodium ovale curtisi]|uniref:PIR Superfamily Protein n=1 Tax=Plasmodium ovale curtisi TaxID=864141 RepID=A0A1A8WEX3_PLAOA|nr:PIR Superfamily Protein [Plasmodium ovale curtisi]
MGRDEEDDYDLTWEEDSLVYFLFIIFIIFDIFTKHYIFSASPEISNTLLNKLPLNKFYNILDNDEGVTTSQSDCIEFKSYQNNERYNLFNLCLNFQYKILNYQGVREQNTDISNDKLCEYFKYWIRDKFYETGADDKNLAHFQDLFNNFSNKITGTTCQYENDNLEAKHFQIKKQFHDYGENLQSIKDIFTKKENLTSEESTYINYLKTAVDYYNSIMLGETCKGRSCPYATEQQRFGEGIKNDDFQSLMKKHSFTVPCLKTEQGEIEKPCWLPEDYSLTSTESPSDRNSSDEHGGGTSSSIYAAAGTLAALLPSFYILQRFIPMGSWIRSLNFMNTGRNVNEDEDAYILGLDQMGNADSYEDQYHIIYS